MRPLQANLSIKTDPILFLLSTDGVNTKLLNLTELRSHLSIIPQDPFLFKGTVRENLDPLSKSSDSELWDALQKSHLAPVIDRLGGM